MKIDKDNKANLYWGYAPLSEEEIIFAKNEDRYREAEEKLDADIARIVATGNKPYASGVRSKQACINCAALIEKISGVKMHVYNHYYP